MYHKRGLWAIKAKNGGVFPRHDKKPAEAPASVKPPKFYPADDVKKPLVNKRKAKPTKLRFDWFLYWNMWFCEKIKSLNFFWVVIKRWRFDVMMQG